MKIQHLFGIAVLTISTIGCGGKKDVEQAQLPSYNIQKLEPVSRRVDYCFPATLIGENEVNLFPQVQGRIIKRHYKDGDFVQKGQSLVEIDPVQFRLQVESDQANVKAAEAALSTAELQYESQSRLFEKKIVSEYVMKTAQNNYQTAQAQLAQAKAVLNNSLTNLQHCTVKAPISGVVRRMHDDIGLLVSSSMTEPILTITDQNIVKARYSITETQYTQIFIEHDIVPTKDGYRVASSQDRKEIFDNIYLRLKDGTIYDQKGEFRNIGGTVDAATGSVIGEIAFENPRQILHAGISATLIFPDSIKNAIVVPQTACKRLQDKYLIFKVNSEGLTEGLVVDVIPTNDGKEYIISDDKLKAGDEIVADGVARIEEGQKVK